MHLVDLTEGSAATFTRHDQTWHVSQVGPTRLWDTIENIWGTWENAGYPGPQELRMRISHGKQTIGHPTAPGLSFTLP